MILGKYIRELLEANKRVILAGFGNLEIRTPDETQSPSGSRIDPPGTSVKFDSSFSKDDGLLASAYALGEGMDDDEALQQVLELIDAIKFALDRGDSYTLPEAGTFVRDEDGKVRFQVDPSWLLEPDHYGLESMDLLELEEEAVEEKTPEKKEEKPKAASTTPQAKPKVTPLAHREPKEKPRKWRAVWIVALLLIIVLAILIVIPTQTDENGERTRSFLSRKPAEEVVDKPETAAGEEESGSTGQQTAEQTAEQDPNEQDAGEQSEDPVSEGDATESVTEEVVPHYFVIAGSFSKLRNASDLQDKLKAKGFEAEVMITENRMYRVSVSSYATKAEGERGLTEIRKTPGLESCWLLSN